jgi:hypothetical protein
VTIPPSVILLIPCLDLLAQTKPKLDDCRAEIRSSLIDDLHHVAFLAEGLTEQRARSAKKNWPFADILDREGKPFFLFRDVSRRLTVRLQAFSYGTLLDSSAKRRMIMFDPW